MIKKLSLAFLLSLSWASTATAGKHIVVNLTFQKVMAYENDKLLFSGRISTGTPDRATPTGKFRVIEKDIDHVSNSWPKPSGGAKMHYMLRLTNYGIAMHLGYVPDYPASHGCIRLENGLAQKMYTWAKMGTPVYVRGHAPKRVYRKVAKNRTAQSNPIKTLKKSTSSNSNRKASTLDILSLSPKAIERVKIAESEGWAIPQKIKKSTKTDPLKALRG